MFSACPAPGIEENLCQCDVCVDRRSQCEHAEQHIILMHIASHFYDACTADVLSSICVRKVCGSHPQIIPSPWAYKTSGDVKRPAALQSRTSLSRNSIFICSSLNLSSFFLKYSLLFFSLLLPSLVFSLSQEQTYVNAHVREGNGPGPRKDETRRDKPSNAVIPQATLQTSSQKNPEPRWKTKTMKKTETTSLRT